MPTNDALSDKNPATRHSSADINRRGDEHWHLSDPHNKALAALLYTSVLKGAWELVARSPGRVISHLRRSSNRHPAPVRLDMGA
jgi:hypothetical protein